MISYSRNEIHQTWYTDFRRSLYNDVLRDRSPGLVMAGGRNAVSSYLSSVEATGDGGETFAALADLPETGLADACLTIIDEDRIFTCGGVPLEAQAHILSIAANSWSRLAYRVTTQVGK